MAALLLIPALLSAVTPELSLVPGKALRRPWFSPLLFRLRNDRVCWGYGGGKMAGKNWM